jgi:replication factor C subunit 3/5
MELFRPKKFDDIVLDPINKKILKNIIDTSYFPNLLFYGPPGTGKTTTIINLVKAYQARLGIKNNGLMIHLNASDERGIDIIRNQINQFVTSKTLFNQGMKFVILDEVDYMTKQAQQALRYILQNYSDSVRFCLICNYISRIDEGLQNEFLRLRFNQLPETDILKLLTHISKIEKLNLNETQLKMVQKIYKSDIRSMINFMQSKQDIIGNELLIINNEIWEDLLLTISSVNQNTFTEQENILLFKKLASKISCISNYYNVDKKSIMKDLFNYIIRNKKSLVTIKYLLTIENILHFEECNIPNFVNYSLTHLIDIHKDIC